MYFSVTVTALHFIIVYFCIQMLKEVDDILDLKNAIFWPAFTSLPFI